MKMQLSRNIIFIAVLIFPLSSMAQGFGAGRGSDYNSGRGRGYGWCRLMIEDMNLTRDQQSTVIQMCYDTVADLNDLYDDLDDRREDMRRLWEKERPDRRAIMSNYIETEKIMRAIWETWLDFRLEVWGLLSEDQRERWRDWFNVPGIGRGPGPGRGRGPCGRGMGRGFGRRWQMQ